MPLYVAVVEVKPWGTILQLADQNQPLELTHRDQAKEARFRFLTAKADPIVVTCDSTWDAPLSEIRVLTALYTQRLYAFISLMSNMFTEILVVSVTNVTSGSHEAFRESWPINDPYANNIAREPELLSLSGVRSFKGDGVQTSSTRGHIMLPYWYVRPVRSAEAL